MEGFFKVSNSLDLIKVQELLLRKYSNITYVLELDFYEGFEIIKRAIELDVESNLWDLYLVDFSRMDKSNFATFSEYKRKRLVPQNEVVTLGKEELLNMAMEIEKKSLKKRGDK